ncbi:transporter substrate-binding domain-containing protein [Halieaceae bacterium IMCC14734]|uniref:Transporter substrate-binding domain-containing protein n=1 Tax=Candidatus Litorirhabdus singularis TaxID=2518993 RepID=A0ABT3TED9_9GAMM|nr:ABC transporter substrate-binding protein [Candidatus Litorirhabdus singularis]MCX2980661.1 transporter substrate-binding domain-containing protein [Candidatus Litorirhabdus singularis]
MNVRFSIRKTLSSLAAATALAVVSFAAQAAEPLKIGYSDWPGWVAWEVAIEKGWFKEAGVDVEFEWFDYVASMDAFAAGQLDAVTMTNGDTLVTGATGAQGVMILINDYSNGNDMIVARPGIATAADLKGKKIGVEVGFVGHLLLLNALEKVGLTESDVELVNVPTNETPQVLASGDVDAIVAWQPNSGQAMQQVPGSKAIASSADEPGLIYDVLAVNPASLARRKADWQKVVKVWYKTVDYILDEKTNADALSIMAARVGLAPDEYAPFLKGTKLLKADEAKKIFVKADGFGSLYGSSKISDDFNLKYEVYTEAQALEGYIDSSLTNAM